MLTITFSVMSHLLLSFPQPKNGAMGSNAPHAIVLREVFVSDGDLSFIACIKTMTTSRIPPGRKETWYGVIR